MDIVISGDTIIHWAAVLTGIGVIGGIVVWAIKFVLRQRRQDQELAATRHELTLICYGVLACLKGLKEKGCNGPVTEALNKLEKHLNQAAHRDGETFDYM